MKRTVFWCATACVALLAVECVSLLLLGLATRRWLPLPAVRAESAAVLSHPGRAFAGRASMPDFMRSEVVHPYLGTVLDRRASEDDYGFGLDASPIQRRSPRKFIVAITGGSLAFMTAEAASARIAERLRRSPPFEGTQIVVLRLALPGHKQPQQLMALNYLLTLGAEFDAVLNLDGYNELALAAVENVPQNVFPAFPRLWNLRVPDLSTPESLKGLGLQALILSSRERAAALFGWGPWRHSPTAALLWRSADRWLLWRLGEQRLATAIRPSAANAYVATGPSFRHRDVTELYGDLAGIWMRSSLLMHELCRANGIRYLHFLQPNQYVPGSKVLSREERETAHQPRSPFGAAVELGYPLLIDAGRALVSKGVRFHDLTNLFQDVGETIYVDTCCHANEKGSALIAAAVGDALREAARSE